MGRTASVKDRGWLHNLLRPSVLNPSALEEPETPATRADPLSAVPLKNDIKTPMLKTSRLMDLF